MWLEIICINDKVLFCWLSVYRKLTSFDDWSSLCVHIAMDNTVIINDISKLLSACCTTSQCNGVVCEVVRLKLGSIKAGQHEEKVFFNFDPCRGNITSPDL